MPVLQEEACFESRMFVAWRIDGWQSSSPQQLPGTSSQMAMDQKGICEIPETLAHDHQLQLFRVSR